VVTVFRGEISVARILITGASGLLGANLVLEAADLHDVVAFSHTQPLLMEGIESTALDLTEVEPTYKAFTSFSPDWVIHCAAETDVDLCERDPDHAHQANHFMARSVARSAFEVGAELLHISTDAVFDGESQSNHENEIPKPVNVYGMSKLEGERAVVEEHPSALIIRTNFFGHNAQNKRSLAEFFLENLEQGKSCKGFTDVEVKFILVNDLCKILLRMIESDLAGIFHVLAANCISKYAFGVQVAREFGLASGLIEPVEVSTLGLTAKRPKRLCLSTMKLEQVMQFQLPTVEAGITHFKELGESGYPERLKAILGGN
jgi:dTDP-4-dehydrorhamnose reductase